MRQVIMRTVLGLVALSVAPGPAAQEIETVGGVRVVHNEKGGTYGMKLPFSLTLVRKVGDIDTGDENTAFHYPSDVAMDGQGNLYVLDSGNGRIQKFGPDGRFLATIGRKGQGPAEFVQPNSIDLDGDGNLVVNDAMQARLQVIAPDGRDARSVIQKDERVYKVRVLRTGNFAAKGSTYPARGPKSGEKKHSELRLLKILDPEGRLVQEFGELAEFGESMTNSYGNAFDFDIDGEGAFYVSFDFQNRVEKYGPGGQLLWRAHRPLNYGTEVKKKGKADLSARTMSAPEMNACAAGIAVDRTGRAWVVTYNRQFRQEEEVHVRMTSVAGRGGARQSSIKTEGNTDLRMTDALKLEVFGPDGVLLGEIPLAHFADVIRISDDNLLLVDRDRGVTVYHYKIVEKGAP